MEKGKIQVVVGSTSEHKIGAVKEALRRLGVEADVTGRRARSDVREQPMGFVEMMTGAKRRVGHVWDAKHPDRICVGIESGIEVVSTVVVDFALIAVLADGEWYQSISPGIVFPFAYYDEARERGFATTTVGSVIAERMGGDATDPHVTFTKGKITRQETLVQGIMIAFASYFAKQ